MIEIVKHWGSFGGYNWNVKEENNVIDIMETESKFFVRVKVNDKDKGTNEIEKLYQKVEWLKPLEAANGEELVFITECILEKDAKDMLKKVSQLDCVEEVLSTIRVFDYRP